LEIGFGLLKEPSKIERLIEDAAGIARLDRAGLRNPTPRAYEIDDMAR
jgi:hypothetical protein